MRRGSALKGFRSLFSRAARRTKAFFGWREDENEPLAEPLPVIDAEQLINAEAGRKRGGDDGDGGSDAMPSAAEEAPDVEAEDAEAARTGYYADGQPFNYGKPRGVSRTRWAEQVAEEREAKEHRAKEAERAREKRDRLRKAVRQYEEQKQLELQRRVAVSQRRARLQAEQEKTQSGEGASPGRQPGE